MVTSNIIEAVVSINRLSAFLNADELQPDARQLIESKTKLGLGDEVLSIKEGEFSWSKESVSPTLEGIDLTIKKGELVGVLGRVGAGKVRFCLAPALAISLTRSNRRVCAQPSLAKCSASMVRLNYPGVCPMRRRARGS